MNYFAQGIMEGGRIGADLVRDHKRFKFEREVRQKDLDAALTQQARLFAAQKELQAGDQAFRGAEGDKDRGFRTSERMGSEAFQAGQGEKERSFRSGERTAGQDFQAAQADLERTVRSQSLDRELASRGKIAGTDAYLKQQQIDWQRDPANPDNAGKLSLARVSQKIGDTRVSRNVPVSDLEKGMDAMGYRSPHEDAIADLERQIAEQNAEVAGGDTRTGFMGVSTSRQDVIAKAQRQRLQLKALELQDQVEKGVITQEEADRRAAALMQQ